MIQGMLYIEEDGQLSLTSISKGSNSRGTKRIIEPDSNIEIHLGNCWIEGQFELNYDDDNKIEAYHFACQDTFCALASGMQARIYDD